MVPQITIWLVVSLVAAILYRIGGIGKPFRSWMRDWTIPVLACGYLLFNWKPDHLWGYLLAVPSIIMMGGALTTYWDSIFGFDNYWFHGFMIGLAVFPFCFCGLPWWLMGVRAVTLAILMGGWCKIFGNDWVEELGRGFFITATLPLLMI